MRLEGTTPAPEFPAGLEWVNAARPVSLGDLRGRIVLIDFWCFCCINCMHIIPELDQLERDFPDELVVLGVHSAKFDGEKDTAAVRQAVERYGIRHLVVNDRDMRIWGDYAVHAWPSLVLIDPAGNIVARASGEHIYEPFRELIGAMVEHWDGSGGIDRTPLNLAEPGRSTPGRVLSFPGKLAADEDGGRLFISDSGNHRIVVANFDGAVQAVIGSGEQGFADGPAESAQFNRPQGMCFDPESDVLYVADTQNHAIRRIDLARMEVTTIAGDGGQASGPEDGPGSAAGRLASPWDLALYQGRLIIAMAGTHQLWWLDPGSRKLELLAGNGRENLVDGPPGQASFSQPSGLTLAGDLLYVADSENSAVRVVGLEQGGRVATIVGAGLFEFGDRDGGLDQARLQHCIGLAISDGGIVVADSYNNRIKVVDIGADHVATILGTGARGFRDGPGESAEFNEPNDVLPAGGRLYIADTNNHAIRVLSADGGAVQTLGLTALGRLGPAPAGGAIQRERLTVPPGDSVLQLELALPPGTRLNPVAPLTLEFVPAEDAALQVGEPQYDGLRISLPIRLEREAGELIASGTVYFCDAGDAGLCYFAAVNAIVGLAAGPPGSEAPVITIAVSAG